MLKISESHNIQDIEFTVKYSRRRTLGISVQPDSSVIVRAPYLTSFRTIKRIIQEKSGWIIKHRDSYRQKDHIKRNRLYKSGEFHLFRGNEYVLLIEKSKKPYIRFLIGTIIVGLEKTDDELAIKRLLYKGYKAESLNLFPELLDKMLKTHEDQTFKPTGLTIRSMKSRWGSCSNKGVITLSTELIKLDNRFIEYVIIHELCHLKHHNHGAEYYKFLTQLYPDWKQVRKELRRVIQ